MLIKTDTNIANLMHIVKKPGELTRLCTLDDSLSEEQLISWVEKFYHSPFFGELSELILWHPQAKEKVFFEIYKKINGRINVANALATLQKCPIEILTALLNFNSNHVKEHAQINLYLKNISKYTLLDFNNLLNIHTGESSLDIAFRSILTASDYTPKEILLKLSNDDYEHIASKAKEKLGQ
ncbi:hypothetical protein V8J88_23915 [Massilia sp. W12]|uniref:hypothetical protein n=1 Tax=Massilia sp. W12 TaxID=3126507 RepID=UPI0030CF47FD